MIHIRDRASNLARVLWNYPTKRMIVVGGLLTFLAASMAIVAHVTNSFQVRPPHTVYASPRYPAQAAKFNESKVALLIENRPFPMLANLMLHFISVVPPDWRFRFMGSAKSIRQISKSAAIREQVALGKLDLTYIPYNMTTGSQEEISRFLTTLWLYEVVLQPAEWLLVFQTDSILCANSKRNLNEFLDYDWVGAPWNPNGQFGGNGGLSLRRVSTIIDILRHQVRAHNSEPEDVWLVERLGHRPGARLANGTDSLTFSGEMHSGDITHIGESTEEAAKDGGFVKGIDDWREGFYEPMGYHTGGSGVTLHGAIWGTPQLRKHIWDYCPEIKMTLTMDAAQFVPGDCNANWKRQADTGPGVYPRLDLGFDTGMMDGDDYPMLPPGLVPW